MDHELWPVENQDQRIRDLYAHLPYTGCKNEAEITELRNRIEACLRSAQDSLDLFIAEARASGLTDEVTKRKLNALISLAVALGRESPDFPRIWSLFGYLLNHRLRREVFEPAHEELKEDWLRAQRLCRTTRERRWLTFCFTVRTAVLVGQSLRVWMGDRTIRVLQRIGLALLGAELFRSLFR